MNILFIDDQTLSNGIEAYSTEYRVLQLRELSEQIQLDERKNKLRNENTLNEKELKQIFYWMPKTVGEVIYNLGIRHVIRIQLTGTIVEH